MCCDLARALRPRYFDTVPLTILPIHWTSRMWRLVYGQGGEPIFPAGNNIIIIFFQSVQQIQKMLKSKEYYKKNWIQDPLARPNFDESILRDECVEPRVVCIMKHSPLSICLSWLSIIICHWSQS